LISLTKEVEKYLNMIEVGLINGLEFATLDCQPIEGIKDLGLGNEGEGIKGLG
jgi:hypothetical protein